ncbi:MAG TPA: hypothetical protein VH042_00480 [Solirubrobacterales bacterium]|jgi:hypothetical protein|nr:hypothetical protein [Solirubrobacterales bacterium]
MQAGKPGVPPFFLAFSTPRRLLVLAAIVLISGAAMLPAMRTMSDHGYSLFAFEQAGSVERSAEIVDTWGEDGKQAAWWQLAFDTPFLIGYGLFAAGACAAVARRASQADKQRLRRTATVVVWFGPLAAAADFLQNISLALILSGHVASPWPQVSATGGSLTSLLMAAALLFAIVGWAATRGARASGLAEGGPRP